MKLAQQAILQKVRESYPVRDAVDQAFLEALVDCSMEICHETGDPDTFIDFCADTVKGFLAGKQFASMNAQSDLVVDIETEAKKFAACAWQHDIRDNQSAAAVAHRAQEVLTRFALEAKQENARHEVCCICGRYGCPHTVSNKKPKQDSAGEVIFGVRFTPAQSAAMAADSRSPRWDLHPPQREEYDDDHAYALGLRDYCDRLIAANNAVSGGSGTPYTPRVGSVSDSGGKV